MWKNHNKLTLVHCLTPSSKERKEKVVLMWLKEFLKCQSCFSTCFLRFSHPSPALPTCNFVSSSSLTALMKLHSVILSSFILTPLSYFNRFKHFTHSCVIFTFFSTSHPAVLSVSSFPCLHFLKCLLETFTFFS